MNVGEKWGLIGERIIEVILSSSCYFQLVAYDFENKEDLPHGCCGRNWNQWGEAVSLIFKQIYRYNFKRSPATVTTGLEKNAIPPFFMPFFKSDRKLNRSADQVLIMGCRTPSHTKHF